MIYSYYSCAAVLVIIIPLEVCYLLRVDIGDRRIPSIALLDPNVSAWVKLSVSGSHSAMITLTGLDYPSFHFLAA